jgi:carbon-monoxide dehydrogenase catalytic subunit
MGLDSYHCVPAPVTGSEAVRQFLDQGTRDLLGGGMVVVPEPGQLAARIVEDLSLRRKDLGWPSLC